jgi:hypothetical protein
MTQEVMNKYEPFIGCAGQKNCGKSSRCKCKLSGMYCTSTCHGERGINKTCGLMAPEIVTHTNEEVVEGNKTDVEPLF